MTRQRQILVTVTYNELGCILDTKAEPYEEPNLQPTCNQLATSCISRQAAIDAIANQNEMHPKDRIIAVEVLGGLPSAQPEESTEERTETHACDCISRQKAFEYFATLWECIGTIMDRDEWEDVCTTTANEIPSAEPEIIRCKDCKHYKEWESEFTPNAVVTQCMADNFPIRKAIPDGWFCAGAERKRK